MAYIREPVSYYLSLTQQQLKATDKLVDPQVWRPEYRKIATRWRAAFEADLTLIPFQKSAFPEGLVPAFLSHATGMTYSGDAMRANVSEPAEVTYLMQTYFRYCYPEQDRAFRDDATLVRRILTETAQAHGLGQCATARSHIRALICCG